MIPMRSPSFPNIIQDSVATSTRHFDRTDGRGPSLHLVCMCGNRPPKLRGVNWDVGLNFTQLNGIPAVHPSEDHAKRHLNSADIAIIGIIDLRGNASDG